MPRPRFYHPLAKLCDASPWPVYALDEQRRIVACNAACTRWLGLPAEELIGQRCDFAAGGETGAAMAAAALCPPPQCFAGEVAGGHVVWSQADGRVERRWGVFVPLSGEEPAPVLAILRDSEAIDPQGGELAETASSPELHLLLQQLVRQARNRYRVERIIGEHPAIRRAREQVNAAIITKTTVLVMGPPGSGRQHVARTIACADQPESDHRVITLSCDQLNEEQLRAALPGSPRRSWRGGSQETTLLLLEVDRLATAAQLELRSWLGAGHAGTRILATAQSSLVRLAEARRYDRDLAHRLSTQVIELPALADRREDIPLLLQRMVEEHNAASGRQLAGFAPAALDRLASLPWPGNVAELVAVVRDACQTVAGVWIGEADLPERVRAIVSAGQFPRREPDPIDLDAFLLEIERELMTRALRESQGNKAAAARLLGISRPRLLRRLEQFGLAAKGEPADAIDFQPADDEDLDQPAS